MKFIAVIFFAFAIPDLSAQEDSTKIVYSLPTELVVDSSLGNSHFGPKNYGSYDEWVTSTRHTRFCSRIIVKGYTRAIKSYNTGSIPGPIYGRKNKFRRVIKSKCR